MEKEAAYTREELIAILLAEQRRLGRQPKKSDMPEELKPIYRKVFGKWCYALEAAGIVIPSQRTLDRRMRHKMKHRK